MFGKQGMELVEKAYAKFRAFPDTERLGFVNEEEAVIN